jgi:hypothetical protein
VQDAADLAGTLGGGDVLSFVNGSGAAATLDDGSDIFIAVDGGAAGQTVFHSYAKEINSGGPQHTLSGISPGASWMFVGVEDLLGGGEQDCEDVVVNISHVDGPVM